MYVHMLYRSVIHSSIADHGSQAIHLSIRQNTVDRLKTLITALNSACFLAIPKSGKKQDHIDRIRANLEDMRVRHDSDKWSAARAVILRMDGYDNFFQYTLVLLCYVLT